MKPMDTELERLAAAVRDTHAAWRAAEAAAEAAEVEFDRALRARDAAYKARVTAADALWGHLTGEPRTGGT